MELKDKKQHIIDSYVTFVEQESKLPTYSDFLEYGITKDSIRTNFGNLTKLHEYIEQNNADVFENLAHESSLFGEKRLEEMKEEMKKYSRFVITTAVTDKKVFVPFYESIKRYCEHNDALLLILGCADAANTFSTQRRWTFDTILKNEYFISKETKLNSNFFISNIKLSAKQINPTTGLSRISQKNGSYVFASPKQSLEYVATNSKADSYPVALMTTGAITVPDYSTERYMSERTSYIAENDHVMGAIVVEIQDDKIFHFRQIQSNILGEFVDLATRYKPDGTREIVEVDLYSGDWHAGEVDANAFSALSKLTEDIAIRNFIVGDFFDGKSISHYDWDRPLQRVKKQRKGHTSLKTELEVGGDDLNWLLTRVTDSVVLVRGNHDDRLENYLLSARYIYDDENHYDSLDLAKALLDGKDVLEEAYRIHGNIREFERIVWLKRDDEYMIGDVDVSQHGDIGANGAKGSLKGFEKIASNAIIGHSHTPGILRGIYQVGTMSTLNPSYRKGASSWMHTSCLIADDGSRQLINFIEGEYKS